MTDAEIAALWADLEYGLMDFDRLQALTATDCMLYRMKRDTVRQRDRADAELLKRRFKLEEP